MGETRLGVIWLSTGVRGETPERIAGALPGTGDAGAALLALARALAGSSLWVQFRKAVLVVRRVPQPLLAVAGFFDDAECLRLDVLRRQLREALPKLRYVSYLEAQDDCRLLAERLRERFGDVLRDEFHYLAIPRGGHIVLGMLAYALDLRPEQLQLPHPPDAPLVVVDDCALSGARFKRFLSGLSNRKIVFAPLHSPPALRKAIEEREPRVAACISAHDMIDEAPRLLGRGYVAWRERWQRLRGEEAYWFGQYGKIGFPWNEPDTGFWNPVTQRREESWNLLPPELCLKNRVPDDRAARIQIQEEGPGPMVAAPDVLYGDLGGVILIGEATTGANFKLTDVGADMWRAILAHGELREAGSVLLEAYEIEEATLRRDLEAFVGDLLARGLLVRQDAG